MNHINVGTQDVSVYCGFNFDGFDQLSSFVKTTNRFYIEDNLINGSVTYIKYNSSSKISQLVFTEREDNVEVSKRTFNVTYPQDKIIYVTEQLNGGVAKQDIITLNDRGKVSKFEIDGSTEYYVYDKFDNLVEHTTEGQGYKKIDYDSYNGVFSYLNVPQWIFLYTTGELIGTGTNNPLTIDRYGQNKVLVETITYNYTYMPRTRYPVSRSYQVGGDTFTDRIQFFKYVFPYKLNLAADRD